MDTVRLRKKLTLASIFLTVGFTNPVLNVNAADVKTYIDDNDELHNYFNNANKEELINSLNENPYLNDKYRNYVKKFINKVYEKYPNIDYAIFNQNLKTLEIVEGTKEEIEKVEEDVKYVQGYYKIYENRIYLVSNSQYEEYILFHELWHAVSILYIKDEKALKNPTFGFSYGTSLSEGMTTYLTNSITLDECLSYENQLSIIEMIIEIYGEDIIYKYLEYGISGITYKLSADSSYSEASEFVRIADRELKEAATQEEIISNYKYLIDLYCKKIFSKTFKSISDFQKIVTRLDCSSEAKKEILLHLKDIYSNVVMTDEIKYIAFNTSDNTKIYVLDKLYVVRIENDQNYFVTSQIMRNYLDTGTICNIYNRDAEYYSENPIIYSITPLREFIMDNLLAFISVYEDKLYINVGSLDYKMYDEKVLTK